VITALPPRIGSLIFGAVNKSPQTNIAICLLTNLVDKSPKILAHSLLKVNSTIG